MAGKQNDGMKDAKSFGTLIYGIMLAIAITRMFDLELGIPLERSGALFVLFTFQALCLYSLWAFFYIITKIDLKNIFLTLVIYLFMGLVPLTFHGILSCLFKSNFEGHHPAMDTTQVLCFSYLFLHVGVFLLIYIFQSQWFRKFYKSL